MFARRTIISAVFTIAACGRHEVSLSNRPCGSEPCLPGYTCDTASQTCIPCAGDCSDSDGLVTSCDGVDDGDGTSLALEQDHDHDGYVPCVPWVGSDPSIKGGGDCNDDDPQIYPGAPELCDGVSNACEPTVPADESDADGDRYVVCNDWHDRTGTHVAIIAGGDCDDHDGAINPGAAEVLDGRDNNCVHGIDECVATCACYDTASAPLLSCYTLDSMDNGVIVDSVSHIDGAVTPSDTQRIVDGRIGRAYDIDSTYEAHAPNDARQDSATFTLQAWVYVNAYPATGYASIVNVQGEYAISVSAAGVAHCGVTYFKVGSGSSSQIVDGGNVPQSKWTHIACASDGVTITLFVDGAIVDEVTPPNNTGSVDTSSPRNVGFGVTATGPVTSAGAWLSGRLDHVMLFTGRRTDEQVCLAAGGSASACSLP